MIFGPRLTAKYMIDVPDFDFDESDPGLGHLGYNNEDSESTTAIRVSHKDKTGRDRSRFFQRLESHTRCGQVRINLEDAPEWYGTFKFLDSTMYSGYSLLRVSYIAHTSDWGTGGTVVFRFRP